MRFTRIKLQSWRNFLDVDVPLQSRVFLVGPNAAGKSNFLDAFRFLRDVADPQGGFQQAVAQRRGVSQIRSLHARRYSQVTIEVEVDLDEDGLWTYSLEFAQDKQRRAVVRSEVVLRGQEVIRRRPDENDLEDEGRLTQTHLEQVNSNKYFRQLQTFFTKLRYLHLVPQLVREPDRSVGRARDPFGGDFLEQLALTTKKTLDARLRRVKDALKVAVPQLDNLELHRDERGVPHLRGLYSHWRKNAGWQNEDQLSDGTLRLLGLLWILLDGKEPLLLEEPELSLHAAVVRRLPTMMARLSQKNGRQVIVSTHSADFLADEGIAPEEVLLLNPTSEDTKVTRASEDEQVRALLEGQISLAEAVLPRTAPRNVQQLSLFQG